jgi:HK97 family phage prohead protease
MQKEHKSFPVFLIKADSDLGIVEAIVAVIGNIDYGDDIIHPGSFVKTIIERSSKVRVLDNHNSNSNMDVIGKPIEMRELGKSELPSALTDKYPMATGGLFTKTQYAIDTPEGLGVFKRIQGGFIDEYSIGFSIPRGKWDVSEISLPDGTKKRVRNIREVKLYEYSPTPFAMNDATMTLDAKGNEIKEMSLLETYFKVSDMFDTLFMDMYNYTGYCCTDVYDYYLIAKPYGIDSEYQFYKVNYTHNQDYSEINFNTPDDWNGGNYQFVIGAKSFTEIDELKAGRMISASNMEKMQTACDSMDMAVNTIKSIMKSAMPEDMPMDDMPEDEMMGNSPVDTTKHNINNEQADPMTNDSSVTLKEQLELKKLKSYAYIKFLKDKTNHA